MPIATPSNNSPDGPVMGNGAVAVAVSAAKVDSNSSKLVFHIDRNDAWVPATGDISACGYDINGAGARTLGVVSISFDTTGRGDVLGHTRNRHWQGDDVARHRTRRCAPYVQLRRTWH